MRLSRHLKGAVLVLATSTLVGCASSGPVTGGGPSAGGTNSGGTSTGSPSHDPRDPLGLIGLWQVSVPGLPAGAQRSTVLRLAAGELSLWQDCGVRFGQWRADAEGLFLADASHASSGTCPDPTLRQPDPLLSWLTRATRFTADGAGWALLDRSGDAVARLAPGAHITPPADVDPSLARPPVVDDAARRAFAEPEPLPSGLRAATWHDLVGRWQAAQPEHATATPAPSAMSPSEIPPSEMPPFLQLAADGTWTSSDGCNRASGRWTLGAGGRVLSTVGPSTLIGCHNVNVAGWWGATARAGLDGDLLALADSDGHVMARLSRAAPLHTMTHGPVAPR